jgi:NADH:ubiquinone oxidoreductase subunit 3 (subunit A)
MTLLGPPGIALLVFLGAIVAALAVRTGGDRLSKSAATVPERAPFAGGLPPDVHAWSRYHVRYYVMALVFLAFDMEMVYMYPWAVVFLEEGGVAMVEMGMFIVILLLGVLYMWRERALEWA